MSTQGRGTVATTSSAATAARSRRPRSFHEATNARAPSSYTSAARALANASRRPLHSAQRRTGHGPGAPHRSQHGGTHRTSRARHVTHTGSPTRPQTPHRRGSNTSRMCTRPTVVAELCRKSVDFVPNLRRLGRCYRPARDAASSSRKSGCTAARSVGSFTGRKRPRAPWRGTTRNVVATWAESSW